MSELEGNLGLIWSNSSLLDEETKAQKVRRHPLGCQSQGPGPWSADPWFIPDLFSWLPLPLAFTSLSPYRLQAES